MRTTFNYPPLPPPLANRPPLVANLSMRVLSRFLASATDASHFPAPTLPEIAFLGRSNVGKSSVINSLVGAKMARTSSTPGRTRAINFFEIRWPGKPQPELIFADLPGYGYAKISREISQEWPKFIDPYMHQRSTLALCVVLIDANVPPQPPRPPTTRLPQRLQPRFPTRRHQERPPLQQSAEQRPANPYPGISRIAPRFPTRPKPAPDASNSGSRSARLLNK